MDAIDWLMESDPAIRWQTMRDLTREPDRVVASERARVATEGWGAHILATQALDGGWGRESPTTWEETPTGSACLALLLLRDMGLDPATDQARTTVARIRDNLTHVDGGKPFFAGETEPCINGMVLAVGSYFGEPDSALTDRLLSEQLEDGGWNCDAPESRRSSYHSTICVLEGLAAHEATAGTSPTVSESRSKGEDYLLDRALFRSLSTGEVIDQDWLRFSYPNGWHYDVLRGLDYLRAAGAEADQSIAVALEVVEANRGEDGLWSQANPHPELEAFALGQIGGHPSPWITLRALRVLTWANGG